MGETPSALQTGLQVFGLSAFVLAPPILFTLTNSQAFFLVHGAGPLDIIAVAVVLTIIIPLMPALIVAGGTMLKPASYVPVWALVSTVLFTFFVSSLLLNAVTIPSLVTVVLSVSIGAAASYLTLQVPKIRILLALLAPVALVTLGTFIAQSEIVFPNTPERTDTTRVITASETPVFMIILDEFSTQTLFNAERKIDKEHFPNFARLARDGVWFRNATTVAEFTINAIPAILTGRYTTEPYVDVPTYNNYPENLFTILHGAGYEVFAYESYTRLCPDSINLRDEQHRLSAGERLENIIADVAVIAGHLFLPENLSRGLPPIEGQVAHFTDKAHKVLTDSRRDIFVDDFFDSIDATMKRLYLLHILVPHVPYNHLPSGERYYKVAQRIFDGFGGLRNDWSDGRSPGAQQRYMLMCQYVDSMIGRLIDRLETLGIYDEAMVIVVADHGVSFRPGYARRFAIQKGEETFKSTDSAMDVLKVPLFMKMPGRPTGKMRDAETQTIDILPTLTSALGIETTAPVDGRDLFAADLPKLDGYRYYSRDKREFGTHALDILSPDYDADRMRRMLDPDRLYAVRTQWDDLIGKALSDFADIETSAISVKFIAPGEYANVDLESNFIPALVRASVHDCPTGKDIALALNGFIVAVAHTVPARMKDGVYFETVIDPAFLRPGKNSLEAFEIRPIPERLPRLLRAGQTGERVH